MLTAAFWNANVRDNSNALYADIKRLGYVERTTNYTTASTSYAGAANAFSSDISFTADGTSTYRIYLYVAGMNTGAATRAIRASLNLNGTETGRAAIVYSSAGVIQTGAYIIDRYLIPSAGAKTVNFRFYHDIAACTAEAGDGTGSNPMPMYMAVYGPIIT